MKANRNRIFQDGRTYHITHRCHNRRFNLRFAIDRDNYLGRMWEAKRRYDVSLLDYIKNLLKKLSCGSEKQFRKWYEAGEKERQEEHY